MGACSCKEVAEQEVEALPSAAELATGGDASSEPGAGSDAGGSLVTVDVSGNKPFARTAIVMIGYQHDYFGASGKLHKVIEASSDHVLKNTLIMLDALKDTSVLFINTPIIFTEDYRELVEPSGILKAIVDVKAFREGETGSETLPELLAYGERILQVPGKRGLNAFTGTCLERLLKSEGVTDVVLCGAVTSVCIDSTGRAAHERGFRVHQLSDCSCGRTEAEQGYYCKDVFPLYAAVTTTEAILKGVRDAEAGRSYTRPANLDLHMQNNLIPAQVAGCQPFERTAVILIGYQHDYFGADGKLHKVIEASTEQVLQKTKRLLEALEGTSALLVETPIIFTEDYRELVEPSGILKVIKDVEAFRDGTVGSETIPEIKAFGNRILRVPGKRGLNAFTGTCLDGLLRMEKVTDVVLCGAVTSVCIDSTGRAAHERGYRVHQLSDCTCGRTEAEQMHYLQEIFPLYANVTTTEAIIEAVTSVKTLSHELTRACLQERLDMLNGQAGTVPSLVDCGISDERAYGEFEKHCSVPHMVEWMQRHPQEAALVRERQEELAVQIQHKLMDHAACMRKTYEEMERQVTSGACSMTCVDLDEDPHAPLVTFLSHGKDEAGAMCRLLKLMLKRTLRVSGSESTPSQLEPGPQVSAPRVFLDSDNIYSQSELRRSVEQCKALTLVLTRSTFFRPWIICEFVTAWRNSVPIILIEVMGSGFDVTRENVEAKISKCVDDSSISLVGQYCPNMTRKVLLECCRALLSMPRVEIDPAGATSAQWAAAYDLAKAIAQQAEMDKGYVLEFATQDPVRDFVSPPEPDQEYLAFISYHHSTENVVVARILKLMIESHMGSAEGSTGRIFLDADSLFDLSSLVSHIERSTNLIVLLTNDLLKRPWVIVELVHAVRNGVSLLPVPITKDFDFRPFIANGTGHKDIATRFDAKAQELFKEAGIRMPEIRRALKQMFNVIAQPFYGHCSETVQRAQIFEITRRLSVQHGSGPMMQQSIATRSGRTLLTHGPFMTKQSSSGSNGGARSGRRPTLPGLLHLSANI